MNRHRIRPAFTLVELLVVIGIIAVLVGILFPVFGKAREGARRTQCSANLHNWGIACHAFAVEHRGQFPMAFHHSWYGVIFPSVLNWDEQNHKDGPYDNKPSEERWKYYGSTVEVLLHYGILQGNVPLPKGPGTTTYTEGAAARGSNLICPSAQSKVASWNYSDTAWGTTFWGHYMYVGGLHLTNVNPNWPIGTSNASVNVRWGTLPPARQQGDSDGSNRILAADEVYWSGGPGSNFTQIGGNVEYRINHPNPRFPKRPDFQNILFADGHVEGRGAEYWTADIDGSNYSTCHQTTRALFYWNGTGPKSTRGVPAP